MLRTDDLQFEGLKIYQDPEGYCFSSDAVLLANYAKFLPESKVVEFCAGTGVISILLSKKQKPKEIHAFEVQKKYCDILEKNIKLNNLQNKIFAHNCRLENASQELSIGYADVVVCNPPYLKKNKEHTSPSEKEIATIEIETSLENVVKSAYNVLKFGGKLFLVHRADRLVDVLICLRNNKLEPKKLRIVYPNKTAEPAVFLIEAHKGGKAGLRIEKVCFASEINKA